MPLESTSFHFLTERIIRRGECVRCGACVNLCPYLKVYEGTLVFPDACHLSDGRCVHFCPRGGDDGWARSVPSEEEPLGAVLKVMMARVEGGPGGQYGGVVTALIEVAMREKGVSGALVTRWKDRSYPEGVVIEDPAEVSRYSGVHYAGAYSLAALNRYRKANPSPLVVVGLPCQMLALRHMHADDHSENVHKGQDDFLIGLFCTWALTPRLFYEEMRRRYGDRRVARYDLPPPPAHRLDVVFVDGERVAIPLEEIRPLINAGCRTCPDMTAEFADISVGAAEGFEGWNTVLVRSARGADLFDGLVRSGGVETRELPEAALAHLKEAAAAKRKRAFDECKKRGEREDG